MGERATVNGMDFATDDLMTWAYSERQLIVVERDDAVDVARRTAREASDGKWAVEIVDAAARTAIAGGLVGAAAGAAAAGAVELWKARKRADNANLPFLVVTASQADRLTFPNGHPLANVVYVGDPGVAGNYYPVASFHRVLFEGKAAEALRLLRSLAATEISVEYSEGFDRGAGVDLSLALPPGAEVEVGGRATRTSKARSGAKMAMQLSPNTPARVPNDLIWFRSEPLWQEVANARIEHGLLTFNLEVNYTEDFGVNANLKSKIAGSGLELGGRFTEFQETVWKLSGRFADQ